MTRHIRNLSLAFILISTSLFSYAQTTDAAIDLEADHGEYDGTTGTATYSGNVSITQGGMKLTGDKVIIQTDKGRVTRVESWGNLATFHYTPSDQPAVDGEGQYMKYNVMTGIIDIEGNAYVKQANNDTHGDRLHYDLKSEVVTGQRVKMSFLPAKS